jgi:4-hydroxybenzoate polyprenyltransferase
VRWDLVKALEKGTPLGASQGMRVRAPFQEVACLLKNCRFHLVAPYINGFVVLFGFLSASEVSEFLTISPVLVFLCSVLHTGAIYSLNNIYDVDSDAKQLAARKDFARWNLSTKSQVALGTVSKGRAALFSLGLFGLSTLYFYVAGGLWAAFFAVIIFIVGWAYSAPPLKLKTRFLVDLVIHGLFWGSFLFLMGASVKRLDFLTAVMPHVILVFFASILWELHNHFEDYQADKEAGSRTFVVRLGLRRSFYVYLLLVSGAIVYSLVLIPRLWSTTAFLGAMILYLVSGLKTAKDTALNTMFLPRKHFYVANLFLLLWIATSLCFR